MAGSRTKLSQAVSGAVGADLGDARSRAVNTILIALISEPRTECLGRSLAALIRDALQDVERLAGGAAVAAVVDDVVEDLAGRAVWSVYAGRLAHGRRRWRSLLTIVGDVAPAALTGAPWTLPSSLDDPET